MQACTRKYRKESLLGNGSRLEHSLFIVFSFVLFEILYYESFFFLIFGIFKRRLKLLPFTFPSLLIGEGNGTPLQYSCLENPMDGLQSMGSLGVGHD